MSENTTKKEDVAQKLANQLIAAITEFYRAKNRHHAQIAAAKMFELAGLPAQYPESNKKGKMEENI